MIRPMIKHAAIAGVVLGWPFLVAACSSDKREGFTVDAELPTQSLIGDDASTNDLPDVDAGSCLSETLGAEPVPLAMLLVMDRSGSMSGTAPSKWDQARQAMIAFADTPGAAGAKLGLTVFPPDPNTGADQCLPSSYAPIVPIDLLPGNGTAIKDALLARATTGSTPMKGALQGGVEAMTTFLASHPNEEGVIILVTDGDPGACSGDTVSNVVSVAQQAASGGSGTGTRVRTFVVGMEGATFGNLDQIAQAGGGAPKAFNASGGVSDAGVSPQQQLLDALESIRSGALGCEYVMPKAEASKGEADPDSVRINFTPGKNDEAQSFKRVGGVDQCGATSGGFYYDDPKNPKRIILCPASCENVRKGTAQAKLDVILDCIRQVK